MLPGCRHLSENNNSSGLFDLLYPELSTSPWHDTDFPWSLVHHTIFDKLLGKRSTFACFWSLKPLLGYSMIFPLADQISVQKTPSTNSSRRRPQRLSKLLTSSAERGLKRANVQKNRKAKRKLAVWLAIDMWSNAFSNNPTWLFVCCNIHFQKYPIFLGKLFNYNRNSDRSLSRSDILIKWHLATS